MNQSKQSQYSAIHLNQESLDNPWFCPLPKEYKTKQVLLQRSMGPQYQAFSNLVSGMLNHVDETKLIQRLMPKNEWVLAHRVRISIAQKIQHYLLIIGAEIKTKTKSMGYKAGNDSYDCQNCYYVIGSREILNEDKFGSPSGERLVNGTQFYEYPSTQPELHQLVMQLMKIVIAKENMKIDQSK